MTNTPYYNLKKPGLGENALITDLNDNSDIIDTALKANADGLAGKVNAEDGKGLSTNDYTTAEKTKLANTYTKTEVDSAISNASHAASKITAGTLGGKVLANASAVATVANKQVRNIYAGTSDMTAGTSALTSGDIYVVYE